MTARTREPTLTSRELNRATLARQLLLEPAELDVVTATERIGGLQAQEPASPYIGLWNAACRLRRGQPRRAFAARTVVKGTLMRATLHAVWAADYLDLWPAIRPMVQATRRQDRANHPIQPPSRAWTARAEAFTTEPRRFGELRDHLGALDGVAPDEVIWWIRRAVAFVHAPDTVPWSFGRRPRLVHADAWLGRTAGRTDGTAHRAPGPALPRGFRPGDRRRHRAVVGSGRRSGPARHRRRRSGRRPAPLRG